MPTAPRRRSAALSACIWLLAWGPVSCSDASSSPGARFKSDGSSTAGSGGVNAELKTAGGGAATDVTGSAGTISGRSGAAGAAGGTAGNAMGGSSSGAAGTDAAGTGGAGGTAAAGTAGAGGASSMSATFNIAYSCDGNQHDHDDFHASPMSLALIAEKGLKGALAHYDYNNHLGDNDASMAAAHAQSIQAARDAYAYDPAPFFDDQQAVEQSVEHLAKAIDAASGERRLYLVCAGPMEVAWRAINAANAANRGNTTAISHSGWNDDHSDTPELTHRWSDIQTTGVVVQHINDQNTPAFKSLCGAWAWLKSDPRPRPWLYDRMCTGGADGDASDAGMVYYVLSGVKAGATATSNPDMAAIKAVFGK